MAASTSSAGSAAGGTAGSRLLQHGGDGASSSESGDRALGCVQAHGAMIGAPRIPGTRSQPSQGGERSSRSRPPSHSAALALTGARVLLTFTIIYSAELDTFQTSYYTTVCSNTNICSVVQQQFSARIALVANPAFPCPGQSSTAAIH